MKRLKSRVAAGRWEALEVVSHYSLFFELDVYHSWAIAVPAVEKRKERKRKIVIFRLSDAQLVDGQHPLEP